MTGNNLRATTLNDHQAPPAGAFVVGADAPTASRLVKGSKSPTGDLQGFPDLPALPGPGKYAHLLRRHWSDEWRIRCRVEMPHGLPPEQEGPRFTEELSQRGARAVAESCEFVTLEQGGFTTFLTLTLSPEARAGLYRMVPERTREKKPEPEAMLDPWGEFSEGADFTPIRWRWSATTYKHRTRLHKYHAVPANPEAPTFRPGAYCPVRWVPERSIQREASRFLEAAARMYARGWVPPYRTGAKRTTKAGAEFVPIEWNTKREKVAGFAGLGDALSYAWVAENPVNDDGEENPHIHVMLRWRVPRGLFHAWAARLERLWGQGFAHLERLKSRQAAGYYLAKAAGYLTKGAGQSDQGRIRGNRYGISRTARAEGWEGVALYGWGNLAALLLKLKTAYKAKRVEPLRQERDRLRRAAENAPKPAAGRIRRKLAQVQARIRKLPAWFGKFTVTLQGRRALHAFWDWCHAKGWKPTATPPSAYRTEFERRQAVEEQRRALLRHSMSLQEWIQARAFYAFYDTHEPMGAWE